MTEKRYMPVSCTVDWYIKDKYNNHSVYDAQGAAELLNKYENKNEHLKQQNRALEFRLVDMLDYIKAKDTVTHDEIKKWWNTMMTRRCGMTEKRFVKSALSNQHIWDNKLKCSYSTIDRRRLLPVLEELEEENEQLKSERLNWVTSQKELECLTEENTMLKQQLSSIDRLINDLGHDEMCRQYNEIIGNDSTNSGNDRRNDK